MKGVFTMTKTDRKSLEAAQKKLASCGGECIKCKKCHYYFTHTERAIYFAVGCDLLPEKLFSAIADVPSQLHASAVETVQFELGD